MIYLHNGIVYNGKKDECTDMERFPRYTGECKIERCTEKVLNNERLRTVYKVDKLSCEIVSLHKKTTVSFLK